MAAPPERRQHDSPYGAAVALALLAAMPGAASAQSAVPDASAVPRAAEGRRDMVVADTAEAAEAGRAMLRQGGSAVDAAIAAILVLGVEEPEAVGIGGGGFLLYFDAATGDMDALDGRETAPAAATADMFLKPDGTPLEASEAAVGGLSVGVPGLLAMLEAAHARRGKLAWQTLFEPAIALAAGGFTVSPRLHELLAGDRRLGTSPAAAQLFYQGRGIAKPAGSRIANPALAATLRKLAAEGAHAFYEGDIAADMVAAAASGARPGRLKAGDLAGYKPRLRQALCQPYRAWLVCGMPPPSSGGLAVLETLGLLERFPLGKMAPLSTPALHLLAEAGRLAFADRDEYVADPDFVPVPVAQLLSAGYLAERAKLIAPGRARGGHVPPGAPRHAALWPFSGSGGHEPPSTTHVSVVDGAGNAAALSADIGQPFGARLMVRGFLLNDELNDFAFRPTVEGKPVANRVEAGKRPRSAMAPTIVVGADGKLALVIGTPGGAEIIGFVSEALVAALDWKLPIEQAIALPHIDNRNGRTEIESGSELEDRADALAAMGHDIALLPMESGLNAIQLRDGTLYGVADPRRGGTAAGD